MFKQELWELWKKLGTGILTVFSLFSFLLNSCSDLDKFFITFIIILIAVINQLLIKLIDSNNYKLLKIKGIYVGSGGLEGKDIIKIEYNQYIQSNTILTLHSNGTGILNPICLLVVIEVIHNKYIQAIVVENDENKIDIKDICSDNNKIENLYASVIIKN